jgi:hypothetical protein
MCSGLRVWQRQALKDYRKLVEEELHNLCSPPKYLGILIQEGWEAWDTWYACKNKSWLRNWPRHFRIGKCRSKWEQSIKIDLGKTEGKFVKWTEWHRTDLNGWFLWTRRRIFGFHSIGEFLRQLLKGNRETCKFAITSNKCITRTEHVIGP